MRGTLIALLVVVTVLGLRGGSAMAAGPGDPTTPSLGYDVSSFLAPTHLGNYVVGDASGFAEDGDPAEGCWRVFDEVLFPDPVPEEWVPTPTDVEVALLQLPPACRNRGAVQLREPDVLVDTCPAGTIFGVRGTVTWSPGDPFAPPGTFTYEGLAGNDNVNEVVFNTCFEIFDPEDDIADIVELVPEPGFGKSPDVVGLTGLDTWLWYDFTDPGSHQIEATTTVTTIEGLPIELLATAWVDQVLWDMDGDGEWDQDVDIPDPSWFQAPDHATYLEFGGSDTPGGAAAVHVYDTKGEFDVAVGVVWRGVYTVVTNGFGGLYEYTPVTRIETFGYQVCELRGVLTSPGEDTGALTTCPVP